MKRTAKDEAEYTAILRCEEPIKTEVITELREQNKLLWANQVQLLTALINAEEALLVYRRQFLASSKRFADDIQSHCGPGCTKHEWRDSDGWHRASDAPGGR